MRKYNKSKRKNAKRKLTQKGRRSRNRQNVEVYMRNYNHIGGEGSQDKKSVYLKPKQKPKLSSNQKSTQKIKPKPKSSSISKVLKVISNVIPKSVKIKPNLTPRTPPPTPNNTRKIIPIDSDSIDIFPEEAYFVTSNTSNKSSPKINNKDRQSSYLNDRDAKVSPSSKVDPERGANMKYTGPSKQGDWFAIRGEGDESTKYYETFEHPTLKARYYFNHPSKSGDFILPFPAKRRLSKIASTENMDWDEIAKYVPPNPHDIIQNKNK